MCVCVCVCVYVCKELRCHWVYTHVAIHACMHACMHACIHAYVFSLLCSIGSIIMVTCSYNNVTCFYSCEDVRASIEKLLLPLLDQLPAPCAPLPLTPLTPSHYTPTHTLLSTLDYVSENLPPSIDVGVSGGALVGVVSELPSSEAYSCFKANRVSSNKQIPCNNS